jgi:hypothetical protein
MAAAAAADADLAAVGAAEAVFPAVARAPQAAAVTATSTNAATAPAEVPARSGLAGGTYPVSATRRVYRERPVQSRNRSPSGNGKTSQSGAVLASEWCRRPELEVPLIGFLVPWPANGTHANAVRVQSFRPHDPYNVRIASLACATSTREDHMIGRWKWATAVGLAAGLATTLLVGTTGAATAGADPTFLGGKQVSANQPSTVPGNGDVNPYGVAVVPTTAGKLRAGDVLVSNFNNAGNQQGTGTTIVELSPGGRLTVFATIALGPNQPCPGGVGLTTALAVFRDGTVVVGSLPTSDGTSATEQAGCLIVLNSGGKVLETISGGPIDGPWDLAATQIGHAAVLFVTNVLNGLDPNAAPTTVVPKGTVVRVVLDLADPMRRVLSETVIANGLPERNDPNALVVGPTGAALGLHGSVLFVASTEDSRITAVPAPLLLPGPIFGPGFTVSRGGALNQPLGLTVAPNGDIITVNGGDGNAVETSPFHGQVATATLDSQTGAGSLFGIALTPSGRGLYFVDDGTNTLNLFS